MLIAQSYLWWRNFAIRSLSAVLRGMGNMFRNTNGYCIFFSSCLVRRIYSRMDFKLGVPGAAVAVLITSAIMVTVIL